MKPAGRAGSMAGLYQGWISGQCVCFASSGLAALCSRIDAAFAGSTCSGRSGGVFIAPAMLSNATEDSSAVAGQTSASGAAADTSRGLAGSRAPGSKRKRSSLCPTNQAQTTPVILPSSKMLVLTASTVMVGPPDLSTTRSPDLKTVMAGFPGNSDESEAVAVQRYQIAMSVSSLGSSHGPAHRASRRLAVVVHDLPAMDRHQSMGIMHGLMGYSTSPTARGTT